MIYDCAATRPPVERSLDPRFKRLHRRSTTDLTLAREVVAFMTTPGIERHHAAAIFDWNDNQNIYYKNLIEQLQDDALVREMRDHNWRNPSPEDGLHLLSAILDSRPDFKRHVPQLTARALRATGLSSEQLADHFHVKPDTIYRWWHDIHYHPLTGKRLPPRTSRRRIRVTV